MRISPKKFSKPQNPPRNPPKDLRIAGIAALPILFALFVWLSPLSFGPVPWPDDSAFYFVAHELFKWPPRWVMLPQAPFEPTYRIHNFNTMPLYPLLLGLGRFLGINGSHALKLWPLGAWAASLAFLVFQIGKARLPAVILAVLAITASLDPTLRWASVLVRPESLIGLCGMILVVGFALRRFKPIPPTQLWDPVAALLAIAAYAHFNAIHLLFPVIAALIFEPRRLIATGLRTALYLSPWALTVLLKWNLFIHQMQLQWRRLAVGNGWLSSPTTALQNMFQDMGNPTPYPESLRWAAVGLWILVFVGLISGFALPLIRTARTRIAKSPARPEEIDLLPAGAWILGSTWLWHTKPEVWFTYYLHLSIWCFAGLALLKLHLESNKRALQALTALCGLIMMVFLSTALQQHQKMSQGVSWRWDTYHSFVDCVDERLMKLEAEVAADRPLKVWCPTFPDITIELSRRHPNWELTRTNDFHERANLAIRHGHEVDAVVVTETLGSVERDLNAPAEQHPHLNSIWMNWEAYFLNRLWKEAGWKPRRHLCQKGRWQAFLFMEPEKTSTASAPAQTGAGPQ